MHKTPDIKEYTLYDSYIVQKQTKLKLGVRSQVSGYPWVERTCGGSDKLLMLFCNLGAFTWICTLLKIHPAVHLSHMLQYKV